MNVTRTFLLGIIPFAALIFFNIRIYQRFLLTRRRYKRTQNKSSQQAKDLQLGLILILVVCMFFVTNLPRLLLNLYELYNVNEMIECGDSFFPPTWFICSTSVNHLLLILNCVMNFVVYCLFNDSFQGVLLKWLKKHLGIGAASNDSQEQAGNNNAGSNNNLALGQVFQVQDGNQQPVNAEMGDPEENVKILENPEAIEKGEQKTSRHFVSFISFVS